MLKTVCIPGPCKLDNLERGGGGGAHIHIFVFTDHKSNRFQKEINCAEHEYMNMSPPPPNYRATYGPVY